MQSQTAYCSACDQDVRVVVTDAPAHEGQAPLADAQVVCLDFGARCTGSMCPMFGLPRILMGVRLAQSGLPQRGSYFVPATAQVARDYILDRRDRDRLDQSRLTIKPDLFGGGQIFEHQPDPEAFQTRVAALDHAAGPPDPDVNRKHQLAEGAVDLAAEPELELHDMAALVAIVQEAGGRFTSLDGEPGPWGGNAVATNGLLHDEVLRRLAPDA